MSNVPAYPKNPMLHPETVSDDGVVDAGVKRKTQSEEARSVIEDSPPSLPPLSLKNLVNPAPVRAILVAAGVGLVLGRLARR
ncbi:MAG: hypothetical protein EOP83_00185 [Verrucomicrobiaceae bacterium]|nr:MAG: hypothetical protein EOP83_00185 [Verrucomicrobiaceae bacterium]